MNKNVTMGIVVIVALALGAYAGYAYEKGKLMKMMESQRMDMQQQIDSAKMMVTPTGMTEPTGEVMKTTTVTPTDTMMKK